MSTNLKLSICLSLTPLVWAPISLRYMKCKPIVKRLYREQRNEGPCQAAQPLPYYYTHSVHLSKRYGVTALR